MKMLKNKRLLISAIVSFVLVFGLSIAVYAQEVTEIVTPTGFEAILTLIPLILVLVLLFLKVDMILAGAISAAVAMVIGGISIQTLNGEVLKAIPAMLSFTGPIVNSAIAMAVFKAGSYTASLELANRFTKGKVEYVSAFIVVLVAAATYASGIGGGSVMVIAPLAFLAVGAVPELIAAISISAAASFISSPASLESSVISKLGEYDVSTHVLAMRPWWLLFVGLAIILAFVGTKRRNVAAKPPVDDKYAKMEMGELVRFTIPAIFLLFSVIFGPMVNKAIGFPLFVPVVYLLATLFFIVVLIKVPYNEAFSSLVEGSSYILTRLFQVGIFLGFINVIALTGTFTVITDIAQTAPAVIIVPVMILAGVSIGIPAGAYVGSILSLILPVAFALGFTPLQVGFVGMGVAFGSQMSFVNISIQALSSGFRIPTLQVIRGNFKWLWACAVLLMGISLFV
jgi:hypothetical protein